jgi:hypothetical protein
MGVSVEILSNQSIGTAIRGNTAFAWDEQKITPK